MKKILLILVLINIFTVAYAQDLKVDYLFAKKSISIICPNATQNVKYKIVDTNGAVVANGIIPRFVNNLGNNMAIIPFKNAKIANYTLVLNDGNLGKTNFSVAVPPAWLNNSVGATDDNWCPKPWTPLKAIGNSISCIGRTYTLNKFGMFNSVVSLKDNLLASPMVWKATVNGKEVTWKPKELTITKKSNGVVHFIATLDSADVTLKSVGKVEFDGYSEIKTTFVNKKPSVTIDKLSLEIPYNSKFATLYHYFPKVPVWYGGVNVSKLNAGSIPEKWNSEHLPFVWIGNEDKGMQWLCESDQYWKLSNKDNALNIVKNGDVTLFTLNIIDKPYTISKPIDYTFSFQASPVKPLTNDKYALHYEHQGGLIDAIKNSSSDRYGYLGLKGYTDYGVKTLGIQAWTEYMGYPTPAVKDNAIILKATNEITKIRDIKLLPYQVLLLSNKAPEYKYFDEIKVVDKNAYNCPGWWSDTAYAVCQNSMYIDFYVNGLNKSLKDFDLGGIYSDSTTTIGYCANLNHGCGYIDDDGTVKPTVRYISVRNYMKRVYKVFEEINKDMIFIGHTSAAVYLPSSSFVDAYLDTEHILAIPRPIRIPLDAFRAEFMGRNFGIAAQCFSYEETDPNKGLTREEMLTLALLHDTAYVWDMEVATLQWKVMDDFGMKDATFMPYWKDYGFKAPEGVYISAYSKPNGDMLVFAANLTEKDITGKINLGNNVKEIKEYLNGTGARVTNGEIEDTFPVYKARGYIVKF